MCPRVVSLSLSPTLWGHPTPAGRLKLLAVVEHKVQLLVTLTSRTQLVDDRFILHFHHRKKWRFPHGFGDPLF